MASTNDTVPAEGAAITPAAAMITELKGKTIRIPDLTTMFTTWPKLKVNPFYKDLKPYVEGKIYEMELDQTKRDDYIKQDLTWFIAVWFPHVDLEMLKVLTLHVLWLFIWDDRVDIGEGALADNLEIANKARANSAKIWVNLLWGYDDGDWLDVEVDRVDAVIEPLVEGLGFRGLQAVRFLDSVEEYIRSCEKEQVMRMEGEVPDYDTYIRMRLDTSAVHTLCALAEYVTGQNLPYEWYERDIIKKIWNATNMSVILINDPISLKKELKTDCIINAVASLHVPGGDVQDAIDQVVKLLDTTISDLDRDLEAVRDEYIEAEYGMLIEYADACKQMVIGTLYFSLRSSRYAVAVNDEDNSMEITL
ncbi:isoprenoid synthase domain-containing protein [Plectosphaerella plurivora]|uniref:Terpene synthase n=1 Tax=Plectosphaerella plurivora TaxID=936078 RepID=A0A9P8V5Q4_9PEZI|nr:isoprenoid synthase domain-containing protein [Plectosphaerella plurivora]